MFCLEIANKVFVSSCDCFGEVVVGGEGFLHLYKPPAKRGGCCGRRSFRPGRCMPGKAVLGVSKRRAPRWVRLTNPLLTGNAQGCEHTSAMCLTRPAAPSWGIGGLLASCAVQQATREVCPRFVTWRRSYMRADVPPVATTALVLCWTQRTFTEPCVCARVCTSACTCKVSSTWSIPNC